MELLKEIEEKYVETNVIKLHTVIAGSGESIQWYCLWIFLSERY